MASMILAEVPNRARFLSLVNWNMMMVRKRR